MSLRPPTPQNPVSPPILLLALLAPAAANPPGDPSALARALASDIRPLLEDHCSNCHGDGANKGGLDLARFLQQLAATPDGDASLLHRSIIVYGGGIADGNRHSHDDLPILLAGHANHSLDPGRIIAAPQATPMSNLYLSLLDLFGAPIDHLGDSTGRLKLA